MSAEMDAVDDIPPQLKAEIARGMDKEIDRQVDKDRGRKALDLFLLFRAGLAVCRGALQEQGWQPPAAPIGEATQRAMAGPEIRHNEAGVPVVLQGRESFNFERLQDELRESPTSWLPALIRTVIETTEEKKVFKEGVLRFVEIVLETRAE